jgi:hypothetical protein
VVIECKNQFSKNQDQKVYSCKTVFRRIFNYSTLVDQELKDSIN